MKVAQKLNKLNLSPSDTLDFTGWLMGLDRGVLQHLEQLSLGEQKVIGSRLNGDTSKLISQWQAARNIPLPVAAAEVVAAGEAWLR